MAMRRRGSTTVHLVCNSRFGDKDKTDKHLINEYSKLAQKKY